jgi:hypothetical protein
VLHGSNVAKFAAFTLPQITRRLIREGGPRYPFLQTGSGGLEAESRDSGRRIPL